MRFILCIILAAVYSVRSRRIALKDFGNSEHEVTYPGNLLDDIRAQSQVAGNRSASLLQIKPPKESVKHSITDKQAKEDLSAAMTQRTLAESQLMAEEEFEAMLRAAISKLMAEAKAVAQAGHDRAYHHGYYRAVKAERAEKAAVEAADEAMTAALQKANLVGREVVFKKMVEHTDLGSAATVGQLLTHLETKVDNYVEKVQENCHKYPQIVPLHGFLQQMQELQNQIRARRGQEFDTELMTTLMLSIIGVTNKAMYFEYVIKHEVHSMKRVFQQDIKQEMSIKMKSEIGLAGFLKHITALENVINAVEEVAAGKSKEGIMGEES